MHCLLHVHTNSYRPWQDVALFLSHCAHIVGDNNSDQSITNAKVTMDVSK